jgi:hypothetical protein
VRESQIDLFVSGWLLSQRHCSKSVMWCMTARKFASGHPWRDWRPSQTPTGRCRTCTENRSWEAAGR